MKSTTSVLALNSHFLPQATDCRYWVGPVVSAMLGWLLLATVLRADTAPVITKYPASQTVVAGQSVTFTVEATGMGFHLLEVKINFADETNLVFASGPGPARNFSHDWAMIRSLRID